MSLIFSVVILSSIGYYSAIGTERDFSSQNEDVQRANESLSSIDYDEDRSSAILQGPLAAVIPVVEVLQTIQTILGNTSGVLQMLFGLPAVVADMLQLFFQLAMGITVIFLVRGAVQ